MNIAILLYDGVTALDAIGPYEVLRLMPGARVDFVAKQSGLIRSDAGMQMLNAEKSLDEASAPDVLVVPGSPDPGPVIKDESILAWINEVHRASRWTTSVCTGALILGAAGLLKGLSATTHWLAHDVLQQMGAKPTMERVVRQGKIITAAGVSSGIDMALRLAALEFGDETAQKIQLVIEYDPQPPFDAGSPAKAPEPVVAGVRDEFGDLFNSFA